MSIMRGMISSSSRNGMPFSVPPIFPWMSVTSWVKAIINGTYDCPQDTFQLEYDIRVVTIISMLSDKVCKVAEMTLVV